MIDSRHDFEKLKEDYMIQEVLIWLLFGGALLYLVVFLFPAKNKKKDCAKGCGGCGSISYDKTEVSTKNRVSK
jgi:hypothetical protein